VFFLDVFPCFFIQFWDLMDFAMGSPGPSEELCMAATAGDQTQWSISSRLDLNFCFQHTETAKKSEKKHHVAETA
jgi:hypothetical protein